MYESFRADNPAGRWSVTVPVADAEQQEEAALGAHQGKPFLAARLRVTPPHPGLGTKQRVRYTLSGPNIRQDGTPGALVLTRNVTRAYVEETYPGTLDAAKATLRELAAQILVDAETARAEVSRVIAGEAP